MKLLEKILLATDFSKSSENVVTNAISLAKTFQSEIILIHVLPDNIKNTKVMSLLNDAATEQLNGINKLIDNEGIKINKPILEHGNQFDKIIQTANKIDANIILIGAGEKLVNDSFQLGTTAEKIIRKSNKPVWVIKSGEQLIIKNILCPVDFSPESERALKNAIIIARRFKAELIVFSVYQTSYSGPLKLKIDWKKQNEYEHKEYIKEFNSFLENINFTDLSWDKEIMMGDPSAEILNAITRYESNLVVMGTTGRSGLSRMVMGSVTEKVIRKVPASFVTVKLEDIINLKLETRIRDIESHYDVANQLLKDGFYNEAINEFEICLRINDMHIPSLNGLANVYDKLNDANNAKKYRNIAKNVLDRIWDRKIEAEVRNIHKH